MDCLPVEGSVDLDNKVKKSSERPWENKELKDIMISELREELRNLCRYFKEVLTDKVHFEEKMFGNSLFACLIQESQLPFSNLVEEVYDKLKCESGITLTSVRIKILSIGMRTMYGIGENDTNVLEDNSDECLWCWEVRKLTLIPPSKRWILHSRRTCREKINERINAVSAMISALEMPRCRTSYKSDMMKASAMLDKVPDIHLLVEDMEKNRTDMADKKIKSKGKELTKEPEPHKQESSISVDVPSVSGAGSSFNQSQKTGLDKSKVKRKRRKSMKWNSCVRCNNNEGRLLTCSSCPITVHESCVGCWVNVNDSGDFCCPHCTVLAKLDAKGSFCVRCDANEGQLLKCSSCAITIHESCVGCWVNDSGDICCPHCTFLTTLDEHHKVGKECYTAEKDMRLAKKKQYEFRNL